MQPNLVIDLRCLQDAAHGERGIPAHAGAIVRLGRRVSALARAARITGVIDATLDPLPADVAAAVDELRPNFYLPELPAGSLFLNLSPMGPGQERLARLLRDRNVTAATVLYDFIPLEQPAQYLAHPATRLAYATALAWLRHYKLFLPISEPTRARLGELLPDARAVVTGVPLALFAGGAAPVAESRHILPVAAPRHILMAAAPRHILPVAAPRHVLMAAAPRHILMVGGDDARKNPEVAIHAHAGSALLQARRIPLLIAGGYPPERRSAFKTLAARAGGDIALLELPGRVPAEALRRAYAAAFCVVTPSRAEGFSLPVVEAMAAGVPSLASEIPAHATLLADPAWRFAPDDAAALGALLERSLDDGWRRRIVAAQAGIWPHYREEAVAARLWGALENLAPQPAPAVVGLRRPRIALLSPLPPAQSGVADASACLAAALSTRAEVALISPGRAAGAVLPSGLAHLSAHYDRVVSALGNSAHFHRIYDLVRRHGGACICHDARLLGFALTRFGAERTAQLAGAELGRAVSAAEVIAWGRDETAREASLLGEIAAAARPLIFHNRHSVAEVRSRFGVQAAHLPFAIYRPWPPAALGGAARAAARSRLGLADGETMIASFGFAEPFKGVEPALHALALLRPAGHAPRLHWVGRAGADLPRFEALAASLGIAEQVGFNSGFLDEARYRDHLLAADIGLQLRVGRRGNVSGALQDCIAAGLPSVANDDLADNIEAPDYVRRVGDELDPAAIGAALRALIETPLPRPLLEDLRADYGRRHDMATYAEGLCRLLGL